MHRNKFKAKSISDIFHPTMDYSFNKVAEAIHSQNSGHKVYFGLLVLRLVQKSYKEFEVAMNERNELKPDVKYDLYEYNHALSKIEKYLEENDSVLTEADAMIYHFYISEEHKHFIQIAKKIDEAYK